MTDKRPEPLVELTFYIPGHVNMLWQCENIENCKEKLHHIIHEAYHKVIEENYEEWFPGKSYAEIKSEHYHLEILSLSDDNSTKTQSSSSSTAGEIATHFFLAYFDIDHEEKNNNKKHDDDNELNKKARKAIEKLNHKFGEILGQEDYRWILKAHAMPGYAVRCEGNLPAAQEAQHGTGGPVAHPIPYSQIADRTSLRIYPRDENEYINQLFTNSRGAGITVAILDTAPKREDVLNFAKANGLSANWLYDSLLYNPDNPLHFSEASFIDEQDKIYFLRRLGRNVHWRSHGFNVASLIRQTAPDAKIHLYRVLNDHGIGSLQSIVRGLLYVLRQHSGDNLVVNCSFTISEPNEDNSHHEKSQWEEDKEFIRLLFEALTEGRPSVTFIGAAGNNGVLGKAPSPHYPGASRYFAAISSLAYRPSGTKSPVPPVRLAYYSNSSIALGDNKIGLAVFGGETELSPSPEPRDVSKNPDIPMASEKGLVAAHVEDNFYTSSTIVGENKIGFAHVAGTSYSAAVASGLAACLMSNPELKGQHPITVLQAAKEDPDWPPEQGVRIIQDAVFLLQ